MSPGLTSPLHGPVSMSIPFAPESAGVVREALVSWLDHLGSPDQVVQDARLVATELVGNSVRHASALDNGMMLVRWHREDSTLALSVCDGGGPTEPERRDAAPTDTEGRGLAIVESLSSRWWVERTSHLHTVHVVLTLDRTTG